MSLKKCSIPVIGVAVLLCSAAHAVAAPKAREIPPRKLRYSDDPAVYTKGIAIKSNVPSVDGIVTKYSVQPSFPSGLILDSMTGVISGTPQVISSSEMYAITALNGAGDTTTRIRITVNDAAPSNLAYSQNPAVYYVGLPIQNNVPTSTGGLITKFAISGKLPSGLSFNTSTGVISGTPQALFPAALFTITGSNSGGKTTATISIAVESKVAAPSISYSQSTLVGQVASAISLPAPSNSGGAVQFYDVSPALPSGLSLNSATGEISGTPTQVTPEAQYTVTARNAGGTSGASISITVNDIPPSNLTYSQNPVIYRKGNAITPNTPSSDGGAVVEYAVSGSLPEGLALNASTGVISGTPSKILPLTPFEVVAKNTGGQTSAVVSISVIDVSPAINYAASEFNFTIGLSANVPAPSNTGGEVVSYSVTPALPIGLVIDSSSGIISGTPSQIMEAGSYTVVAFNSGGFSSAQLAITVNDIAPANLTYSQNPAVYKEGQAIVENVPSSSGGAITRYEIDGVLPDGLSFNTLTGVISGTPAEVLAASSYSITASNSGGSTSTVLNIQVNPIAGPPTLASTFLDHQLFSVPVITIPITVNSTASVTTKVLINGAEALQTQSKQISANLALSVGKNAIVIEAKDEFGQTAAPIAFNDIYFNPPALDSGLADPAVVSPAFNMPTYLSDPLLDKLSILTSLSALATNRTDPFACDSNVELSPPTGLIPDLSQIDPVALVTPELQSLASRLGSADQIYFYVRDQIKFLPRFGLTQTAAQTLQSGYGTAADKAALLIALFRASNIPARYITGTVLVDENRLKGMYGVDGAKDLAWAQYMSLKGYFQALYPTGFDGSEMIYYQNGRRTWQIPHIWVYAQIQTEPGVAEWIEVDPTSELVDYSSYSSYSTAYSASAVENFTRYLSAIPEQNSVLDVMPTDRWWESWRPGLVELGPSVLNSYSIIPHGSLGESSPCINQESDFLGLQYQFTSHVRVIDPVNPLFPVKPLVEARTSLMAASKGISLSIDQATSGPATVLRSGSEILGMGAVPQGRILALYHAIQEPVAYGGATEARVVSNRPVEGLFLIRHSLAPLPMESFYTDLRASQSLFTASAAPQSERERLFSLLRLGTSLALAKAAGHDLVINRHRAVNRVTEHLLLVNSRDSQLIPTQTSLFGVAPTGINFDWNMTGPIYSETGDNSDFQQYLNIANAKGDLVAANSVLEGQVWSDLFGSGGTSAAQILQKAYRSGGLGLILGQGFSSDQLDVITAQLSTNLASEISVLKNIGSQYSYLFSLTDQYTTPSGGTGAAFIVMPWSPIDFAGAYLIPSGAGALLGGIYGNSVCTPSDTGSTCVSVLRQEGVFEAYNYYYNEWHANYSESFEGEPCTYTLNMNKAWIDCRGQLVPGMELTCYTCREVGTETKDCASTRLLDFPTQCTEWKIPIPNVATAVPAQVSRNQTANGSPANSAILPNQCGGSGNSGAGVANGLALTTIANPVNLASGAMWHSLVDFAVPGRTAASDLVLKRTYTSQPVQASAEFGPGWWHNLETQLILSSSFEYSQGGSSYGCPSITLTTEAQQLLGEFVLDLPKCIWGDSTYILSSFIWVDENGGPWTFTRQDDLMIRAPIGLGAQMYSVEKDYIIRKADGTQLRFAFGDPAVPDGKLRSITDVYGESVLLTYEQGKLATATSNFAGTVRFNRNSNGLVESVTRERDGLTYRYTYNADGKLETSSDFDSNTTRYEYNQGQEGAPAHGLLSSITDPLGRKITYTYYDDGRAFEQTEPGNGHWTFFYSPKTERGNYVSVRSNDGTSSEYRLNKDGLIAEIIHPDQSRSRYITAWNGTTTHTDELGMTSSTIYDDAGRILQVAKANGVSTHIGRDRSFGRPIQVSGPNGTFTFVLDPQNGNMVQAQNTETGLILSFTYDSFGNLLGTSNNRGSYANQTDENGLFTFVYDSRNPETRTYDSRGRVATRTFQNGRVFTYSWDNFDRITKIQDNAGPNIVQVWDKGGRLESRAIVNGFSSQKTQYGWDDRDRLISVTDPLGRKTQIQYDKIAFGCQVVDKPSLIIDPAGRKTQFFYDRRQRLIRVVDANGGVTRYDYNLRGDLTGVTDAANNRTAFDYDDVRRVIQRKRPTATVGQDGTPVSGFEVTTYVWDDADRLKKETTGLENAATFLVTEYEWDALSRLTRKHVTKQQSGSVIEDQEDARFTYESQLDAVRLASANNGVAKLTFTNEAVPPFAMTGFSVAAADLANPLGLVQDTFVVTPGVTGGIASVKNQADSTLFSSEYDLAGRLTKISSGSFTAEKALSIDRTYDGLGRLKTSLSSAGLSGSYSWDDLNRVTSIKWNGLDGSGASISVSESPSYDPLTGNITSVARESGKFNYSHDPVDQLISVAYSGTNPLGSAVNRSFVYDYNGNRVSQGTQTVANVLTQDQLYKYVPDPLGAGSLSQKVNRTSGATENFTYRADQKLVSYSKDGLVAEYFYDALGRRVAKKITKGSDPAFTQSYVHLGDEDKILLGRSGDGEVTVYLDGQGIDEHLGEVSSRGAKAYAVDHLGSVLNGEAAGAAKAFGAWGENLNVAAPEINASSPPVVYGYTGRQLDPESQNYFYRARTYLPDAGRFLTKDPVGFAGGDTNLYRYVFNNPLLYTDPTGEVCEFSQSTGRLSCWNGPVGPSQPYLTGSGYSGASPSINNPASQGIPNGGVTPAGTYTIGDPTTMSSGVSGRPLVPNSSNVCPPGRNCNSFWMHGGQPGHLASTGCAIINNPVRDQIPGGETIFVTP